jgi:hypothetical protein
MNSVDRYLEIVTKLGLPKFGWKLMTTKVESSKRDIRTSFTGGFAKVAFAIHHTDVPFVVIVSDDVRDVLTTKNEDKFNIRATYHRSRSDADSRKPKQLALPFEEDFVEITPDTPLEANAIPAEIKVYSDDKVANKLIARFENPDPDEVRAQELREKKAALKDNFDNFKWTNIGFGEAQEGTIGNYTFYFGPSKTEGKFFYKINGVRCRDSENRNTLDEVKDKAFESFWLVLLAKEKSAFKKSEAISPISTVFSN